MTFRRLIAASVLLVFAAAPAWAAGKARPKKGPAAAVKLPEGWTAWNTLEGGFGLNFPGEPVKNEQEIDTDAGKITAKMFILEADEGAVAYMAGYNDYPKDTLDPDPNKVLDGARDGAVGNVKGTLKSEKRITVDGHPGRELVITTQSTPQMPGMVTHARAYLVNGRLMQALVVMPEGKVNDKNVRSFLDSFHLTKK